MSTIDFIRINEQAVRVTSLTSDPETGALTVVVIARGSAARDQLAALLTTQPIMVALPDHEPRPMRTASQEQRQSGEGERAIYRFAFTLVPDKTRPGEGDATGSVSSAGFTDITSRLDALEGKLDRILAILEDQGADNRGRPF